MVTEPLPELARSALMVLERHRGTALSPDALREEVRLEGARPPEDPEELLRTLESRGDLFRVLRPRRRRWAGAAPRSWILARTPTHGAGHPILDLLRTSLQAVGSEVDPESLREMIRWERLLHEEGEVHRALRRRLRREARRRAGDEG
jgi:hypothetical protein